MASSTRGPLTKLTRDVYFSEPVRATTRTSTSNAPHIVLMMGWMDAQMKHLEKYIEGYHRVFPTSTILLVRSTQTSFYSRASTQRRAMSPAVEFLRARLGESGGGVVPPAGPGSSLLVHTFSNGGCLGLKMINDLMLRSNLARIGEHDEEGRALLGPEDGENGIPARAIVFDSCPGGTSLAIMVRAFTAPLRHWWIKAPAMVVVALFYGLGKVWNTIRAQAPVLDRLNDYIATQLPMVPRLYLYSESDLLIPFKDVEKNAQRAQEQGVKVTMLKFEDSDHVSHARKDPKRYWGAIKELWKGTGHTTGL